MSRRLAEVVEVEQTVDLHVATPQDPRLVVDDVVLVADLPDQLLDQVLEGDDARGAAVLVDHDGEVVTAAAHLRHRRQYALRRRQHEDLAREVADLRAAPCRPGRCVEVAHVHEADHFVVRTPDDGVAGVRQRLRGAHCPRDAPPRVEELDLGARHHDLAQLPLAGLEHLVDQRPLVPRERLVGGDEVAQLLLRDAFAVEVRVAAEQADSDVRRGRECPDDRPHQPREPVECGSDGARRPLGPLQRDPFRRQLPDDEGHVGDDERHPEKADDASGAVAETEVAETVGGRLGQRHRAEGAGQQSRGGDADLHGGQEAVGVLHQPGDPLAAPAPLGQGAELALAQRHQRHLARDEDAFDHDERDDDEGASPHGHQRPVLSGLLQGSSTRGQRLATSDCLARTASAASLSPASSESVRSRSTTFRTPPLPSSASTPR